MISTKKVSVVITNYNGLALLQKNLPAVKKACLSCEIIIVDDGSTDGSTSWVSKKFPNTKVLANKDNKGFSYSVNRGVKAAKYELVLILNNDVVPRSGFLPPLVKAMRDKEKVFSAGCLELSKDKYGKIVKSGKSWFCIQKGILVHNRCPEQTAGETAWCQGGSMLVKKDKFLRLGGFDTIYAPGYWEDIDLGWRAQQVGFINWFCSKSVVEHNHGSTFDRKYSKQRIKITSYRNSFLFAWRNFRGKALLSHFLWMPYNLVYISIKTKGLYFIAWLRAVGRILTYAK